MDVFMRPNSAAVRRRSNSISHANTDDEETEQSSDNQSSSQSSPQSSDDASAESSLDKARSDASPRRIVLGPRLQDPRASRHSSRRAATKPVIYSSKHHPQDYGLPGYQYKAIAIEDDESEPPAIEVKKRKVASSDIEQWTNDDIEKPPMIARRARKKLKSLNDPQPGRVNMSRGRPAKTGFKARPRALAEVEDLVEVAIQGSQAPHIVLSNGNESGDETDDTQGGAVSDQHLDDPRRLLEACTSNFEETDDSGDREDADALSIATMDTSTTLKCEVATPVTTFSHEHETLDPRIRLPTYLKDRIALGLGTETPSTAGAVLRMLFDEPHAHAVVNLVVQRPYLHHRLQPTEACNRRSDITDCGDGDEDECAEEPSIEESQDCKNEEDDDDDHADGTGNDPHESHSPLEKQLEEQMEDTRHLRYAAVMSDSDDLADSDPIHSFSAIN